MEQIQLTRQDATCTILYRIELIKTCRYKEHKESVGPSNDQWYNSIEEAILQFALWFYAHGYELYNVSIADCCAFMPQIWKKATL